MSATVNIVGAGPTGALLSILMRRRGFGVTVYESRADPRKHLGESGRSINLALADRGIHALARAGVLDAVAGDLIAMRGRMIHDRSGGTSLQPYGQRASEVIYSVSRHRLNQALLEVAGADPGITLRFEQRVESVDFGARTAWVRDLCTAALSPVPMSPLLAADGAGSPIRRAMAHAGLIEAHETDLEHGYKELSVPAAAGGTHAMAPDALHIWPRGDFMMIALPNADGSFTATLFLAKRGEPGFDSLNTPGRIGDFLRTEFPDAFGLMPDCVREFQEHPTGFLGTVYADRWNVGDAALLIGDAAHAIVPFHGQGMNCCFEDCVELDRCLGRTIGWQAAMEEFFASRKPNTDAIAAMALDNYLEMRARVAEPKFQLQQQLALELERRHPHRFVPRYAMVMFHHEIPYSTAERRGAVQARLLAELTAKADSLGEVDYAAAERAILSQLPPLG